MEGPTYKGFLTCLDTAKREYRSVYRATTNKKTLTLLLDDVDARWVQFNGRTIRIYGTSMEVDGNLPDNAIKIDGRMYNMVDCQL